MFNNKYEEKISCNSVSRNQLQITKRHRIALPTDKQKLENDLSTTLLTIRDLKMTLDLLNVYYKRRLLALVASKLEKQFCEWSIECFHRKIFRCSRQPRQSHWHDRRKVETIKFRKRLQRRNERRLWVFFGHWVSQWKSGGDIKCMHDTRASYVQVSVCLGENDNVRREDVLARLLASPSQSDIFGFNIYT